MYYAAYGSNLNRSQIRQICGREVELFGTGVIENWELEFRLFANIKRKKGGEVPVAVWMIDDEDIIRLDQFEGVHKGYYRRAEIKVKLNSGAEINATVYILKQRMDLEKPYPTYYEVIHDGYSEHNLNVTYLKEVVEKSPKNWWCKD